MQQYLKDVHGDVEKFMDKEIELKGWIRNHRKQKEFGFIDFYDGTSFKSIQVVYDNKLASFDAIQKLKNGSSIEVRGKLIKSVGSGQEYEVAANDVILIGTH